MPSEEPERIWELDSPEAMFRLGEETGRALQGGETLALVGPIGAGKTLFTKGLASALGVPPDDVASPTFILMALYPGRLPLLHADAFRLEDPEELVRLGWDQWAQGGVRVVEWAERVRPVLDDATRWLTFEVAGPDRRRVSQWRKTPPAGAFP